MLGSFYNAELNFFVSLEKFDIYHNLTETFIHESEEKVFNKMNFNENVPHLRNV